MASYNLTAPLRKWVLYVLWITGSVCACMLVYVSFGKLCSGNADHTHTHTHTLVITWAAVVCLNG